MMTLQVPGRLRDGREHQRLGLRLHDGAGLNSRQGLGCGNPKVKLRRVRIHGPERPPGHPEECRFRLSLTLTGARIEAC